jgi:diacylglycerol O-acyltransferase / trehalose O-mycolyltransferase / mycolyltransferase Ag85
MLADFDAQPGRKAPPRPEPSPTQREADEAELYAGLHGLAGIVAGAQGVIDLLRDVAEFAAQAIPGADGRNAVGGLSMSGGSAIDLAIQAPGLYRASGSYSGCPATSDPKRANQIALSLIPSGANAANMWSPLGGPDWVTHDPSKNVIKLKGVAVYAAASTGAVGAVDNLPPDFPTPVGGRPVEGITLDCTQQFADAAKAAGVPITFVIRPGGAHTWGLFESEMQESWNTLIGPALGAATAA